MYLFFSEIIWPNTLEDVMWHLSGTVPNVAKASQEKSI
jgi:hypothetical protein